MRTAGGYSLGEADLLRRAMGKKDHAEMAKQRERFMAGAAEKKHPKDMAGKIFDLMAKFAGYGFNKSHSAAYSLLAYHTAYLKTHYPVEFMAALLTSETSKPENVVKYISECREIGIPVLPPNVQISHANFTPVTADAGEAIGFGLAAIKNVGHNAIESIMAARGALGGRKAGFASLVGVLREGGPAAAEQAGAGVADQGRRDGLLWQRARGDGGAGPAMERAQKGAEGHGGGTDGLVRDF